MMCLQLKKSARRLLREKPSGSTEDGNAVVSDAQTVNSIEKAPVVKIEKIGDLTPVQDFEAIMSRRDRPDWVGKAIKEMRDKILGLLTDSHKGDNYLKAVECIAALRKGCILEQVSPSPSLCFRACLRVCIFYRKIASSCFFVNLLGGFWCFCLMV